MHIWLLTFVLTTHLLGAQDPNLLKPGRYAGFVKLPDTGLKIATVLDTVYVPAAHGQKPRLAAYLKLSFGGFRSHEYLTHFYLVPDYDWSADEMILDAVATGYAKDLTLNTHIEDEGNRIRGKMKTVRGVVKNGEIELHYLSPSHLSDLREVEKFENPKIYDIYKDVPIMPLLTGSYRSEHPMFHTLQLEATKQSGLLSFGWLPMEGYVIRGRILGQSEIDPDVKDAVIRSLNKFEDIEINPYRGQVNFPNVGPQMSLGMCKRTKDGFSCGACTFKAIPEEKAFLDSILGSECGFKMHPFPLEVNEGIKISSSFPSNALTDSEYRGEIHFENRDMLRPFSIAVNVTGAPIKGDPTIAKRTLTFLPSVLLQPSDSDKQSVRSLPIQISPFQIDDKYRPMVLMGPTGDSIEIIQWTETSIFGIFYSASFGRVGTFRVYKNGAGDPPVRMEFAVPGTYLSPIEFEKDSPSFNWIQSKVDLEWVTSANPLSPTPYNVGGLLTHTWDSLSHLNGRNDFSMYEMQYLRFDAFTGIVGADISTGQAVISLFMKIEPHEVGLVMASDAFLVAPRTPYHRRILLRKDTAYGIPKLPDKKTLRKGALHVFIPFDAVLYINDVRMKGNENTIHRTFAIPDTLAHERTYTLRAELKTGRALTQKVTLTPANFATELFSVDFFALQEQPRGRSF